MAECASFITRLDISNVLWRLRVRELSSKVWSWSDIDDPLGSERFGWVSDFFPSVEGASGPVSIVFHAPSEVATRHICER
jgi:hypothetical protein